MSQAIDIREGDCLEVMRGLPADSVDSVVTDPPYGIRFMGKAWDGEDIEKVTASKRRKESKRPDGWKTHNSPAMAAGGYDFSFQAFQAFSEEWGREALRVLKPGGHLVSFASTRTYHRMVCGLEDGGFEIRDQLAWVFGSGFPKSSNQDGEWEGWGTALKPAWEPIVLARKPLVGNIPTNLAAHRTGALHIDACRVKGAKGNGVWGSSNKGVSPERTFVGSPGAPDYKSEENSAGRWPANLCHDGSPEVVNCFPSEAGAAAPVHRRNGDKFRSTYGEFKGNIDEKGSTFQGDAGSAARFFYCAKASAADREAGCESIKTGALAYGNQAQAEVKRGNTEHKGQSGMNSVKMRGNIHPTVKPTDLMRWLVRLVTPPQGLILDPFMGSGSTGRGAVLEGFRFIGIEKEPAYLPIARARITEAAGPLFSHHETLHT